MPTVEASKCPVNSWNEWDPLEEVLVGRVLGSYVSTHAFAQSTVQPNEMNSSGDVSWEPLMFRSFEGQPFPPQMVLAAHVEIEEFVGVLKSLGIQVRRPDPINSGAPFSTPLWSVPSGYNTMNPRDLVMVMGDQLIEAPTCSRQRYFETFAWRRVFNEYHRRGARWVSAPKPMLADALYNHHQVPWVKGEENKPENLMTTEFEPVFDAASFVRCGRDLFVTRDCVTNRSGIEWLERHLGSEFRIHQIGVTGPHPLHIDSTFLPIAPGKALANKDWIGTLPPILKKWELLEIPKPDPLPKANIGMDGFPSETSSYISMNVLSIDGKRIVVEQNQVSLIKRLKEWGFEPIPLSYRWPPFFGGGFHCTTLDIRRSGTLQSYF